MKKEVENEIEDNLSSEYDFAQMKGVGLTQGLSEILLTSCPLCPSRFVFP